MYISDAYSSEAYRLWAQAQNATKQTAAASGQDGGTQESTATRPADIWRSLAAGLDLTNATQDQLSTVGQGLYDNGQISMLDYLGLTFGSKQDASAGNADTYFTEADGNGKRDWVAEFQARLAGHMESGDTALAAADQRVLGILHRLEAAASGGVNVTV